MQPRLAIPTPRFYSRRPCPQASAQVEAEASRGVAWGWPSPMVAQVRLIGIDLSNPLVIEVDPNNSVSDLKARALQQWPAGGELSCSCACPAPATRLLFLHVPPRPLARSPGACRTRARSSSHAPHILRTGMTRYANSRETPSSPTPAPRRSLTGHSPPPLAHAAVLLPLPLQTSRLRASASSGSSSWAASSKTPSC